MRLTDYVRIIRAFDGQIMSFPPVWDDPDPKGRRIYIRHDVDQLLTPALDMAKLENEDGIRSTYFLLNTADYFPAMKNEPKYLQDLGHEVGWHNNALSQFFFYDKGKGLKEIIETALKELRDLGVTVRGTASHGDEYCGQLKYINYHIWPINPKTALRYPVRGDHPIFQLSDFGLEYEAYFLKKNLYLSDSGGYFNADPATVAKQFNAMENCTLQILCHPEHWQEI